jgi:Raf kinase inhibitor-like YbhB/YbcL family protein
VEPVFARPCSLPGGNLWLGAGRRDLRSRKFRLVYAVLLGLLIVATFQNTKDLQDHIATEASRLRRYTAAMNANRLSFGSVPCAAAFAIALGAQPASAQNMTVTSTDISDGGTICNDHVFNGFGCTGKNISPSLSWSGAPSGTKSFAITVYDPDAPTGSGWWHWVVFNIPAATTSVPKNVGDVKEKLMPADAIQSRTDFGTNGYGGPCPPKGNSPHIAASAAPSA